MIKKVKITYYSDYAKVYSTNGRVKYSHCNYLSTNQHEHMYDMCEDYHCIERVRDDNNEFLITTDLFDTFIVLSY